MMKTLRMFLSFCISATIFDKQKKIFKKRREREKKMENAKEDPFLSSALERQIESCISAFESKLDTLEPLAKRFNSMPQEQEPSSYGFESEVKDVKVVCHGTRNQGKKKVYAHLLGNRQEPLSDKPKNKSNGGGDGEGGRKKQQQHQQQQQKMPITMTATCINGSFLKLMLLYILLFYVALANGLESDVTCPALPPIPRAKQSGCDKNRIASAGTVCKFSCPPGYKGIGNANKKCLPSGEWNSTCAFTCVEECDDCRVSRKHECPSKSGYEVISAPYGDQVTVLRIPDTHNFYGKMDMYKDSKRSKFNCNTTANGLMEHNCSFSMDGSTTPACPGFSIETSGTQTSFIFSNVQEDFTYCLYIAKANSHHIYQGGVRVESTVSDVTCPAITPTPPAWQSGCDKKATAGTICTFFCPSGYEVKGDVQKMCMKNGTWTSTNFTCEEASTNDDKTKVDWIVVVVLLSLGYVPVVIIGLLWIKNRRGYNIDRLTQGPSVVYTVTYRPRSSSQGTESGVESMPN